MLPASTLHYGQINFSVMDLKHIPPPVSKVRRESDRAASQYFWLDPPAATQAVLFPGLPADLQWKPAELCPILKEVNRRKKAKC